MKLILPLAAIAAGILAAIEPGTPAYRFDEVKSKVLRAPGGDEAAEVRVAAPGASSSPSAGRGTGGSSGSEHGMPGAARDGRMPQSTGKAAVNPHGC